MQPFQPPDNPYCLHRTHLYNTTETSSKRSTTPSHLIGVPGSSLPPAVSGQGETNGTELTNGQAPSQVQTLESAVRGITTPNPGLWASPASPSTSSAEDVDSTRDTNTSLTTPDIDTQIDSNGESDGEPDEVLITAGALESLQLGAIQPPNTPIHAPVFQQPTVDAGAMYAVVYSAHGEVLYPATVFPEEPGNGFEPLAPEAYSPFHGEQFNPASATFVPGNYSSSNGEQFNPTSPGFVPAVYPSPGPDQFNPVFPAFIPGGYAFSPDSSPQDPSGQTLKPTTVASQPGVQVLDPSTEEFHPSQPENGPRPGEAAPGAAQALNGANTAHVALSTVKSPDDPAEDVWNGGYPLDFSGQLNPSGVLNPEDSPAGSTMSEAAPQPESKGDAKRILSRHEPVKFDFPGDAPPGYHYAVVWGDGRELKYILMEDVDDGDDGADEQHDDNDGSARCHDGEVSRPVPTNGLRPPNGGRNRISNSRANGLGLSTARTDGKSQPVPANEFGHTALKEQHNQPSLSSQPGPPANTGCGDPQLAPSNGAGRAGIPREVSLPYMREPRPAIPPSSYHTGDLPRRESRPCSWCSRTAMCTRDGSRCIYCFKGKYI